MSVGGHSGVTVVVVRTQCGKGRGQSRDEVTMGHRMIMTCQQCHHGVTKMGVK